MMKVPNITQGIASMLGVQVRVNDLAVNPASQSAYLAVTRGGGAAEPVLIKVDRATNKLSEFSLKDVPHSKVSLTNASDRQRQEAITCMAFVKGKLYVAGLSNEDFASTLRGIPFPFKEANKGAGIQIFHGAHGRLETQAPVRTFAPLEIKGETHLLASYQCTPLVKIPVDELKPGAKVKGTTVAELGNRNRPLDIVIYEKGGKQYALIANNSRGVMKVALDDVDAIPAITKPVRGGGTAGLKYETIAELKSNVEQLARLDDKSAVVLIRGQKGTLDLDTIPLP